MEGIAWMDRATGAVALEDAVAHYPGIVRRLTVVVGEMLRRVRTLPRMLTRGRTAPGIAPTSDEAGADRRAGGSGAGRSDGQQRDGHEPSCRRRDGGVAMSRSRPPWRAIAAIGVASAITLAVIAAFALREQGSSVASGETLPQSAASASANPSASSSAVAAETTAATTQPSASSPPERFTQAASFPGASASALTAWPGGWAAIGQADAGAVVWLSADGADWESILPPELEDVAVNDVVAIPDGRLLAFGFRNDGPFGVAGAWLSADGRSWESIDLGIPDLVNAVDVVTGPVGIVMIGRAEPNGSGRNEYAWYSEDGLTWDRVWDTTDDESPAAVGSGPEGFVIVGQQGYEQGADPIGFALASADGREWIEAPTDGPVGMSGMWSVVPIGSDWMATSLGIDDVQVLRSPNGLDWTIDTTFTEAEARRGGIAQLDGDGQFALLSSILVPRTVLPVMLYAAGSGWQDTDASATGGIAAASREGTTVLMVNTGLEDAPEIQFWVAATPG